MLYPNTQQCVFDDRDLKWRMIAANGSLQLNSLPWMRARCLMQRPNQVRTVCNCLQSSLRFSFSGTGRLFNRKFISSWVLNLPNERMQAPFWYTGWHTFRKPPGLHQVGSKVRWDFSLGSLECIASLPVSLVYMSGKEALASICLP